MLRAVDNTLLEVIWQADPRKRSSYRCPYSAGKSELQQPRPTKEHTRWQTSELVSLVVHHLRRTALQSPSKLARCPVVSLLVLSGCRLNSQYLWFVRVPECI